MYINPEIEVAAESTNYEYVDLVLSECMGPICGLE